MYEISFKEISLTHSLNMKQNCHASTTAVTQKYELKVKLFMAKGEANVLLQGTFTNYLFIFYILHNM